MRILELDNDKIIYDSKHIRIVCCVTDNHLWADLRRTLNIQPKARKLSLRQSFLLWVASNLHKNGIKNLTNIEIMRKADELLKTELSLVESFPILAGSKPIKGKDLVDLVEYLTGKKVTKKTFYNHCNTHKKSDTTPRFSTEAEYTPEQLRRILKAIAA